MRHQQQMLVYTERSDDIATVTRSLDMLREGRADEAARILTIYLDRLQESSRPKLMDYDPRVEAAYASR